MFGEALGNGGPENGPVRADAFARALVPVVLPRAVVARRHFRIRRVVERREFGTRRTMKLTPMIWAVSSEVSLNIHRYFYCSTFILLYT